LNPDVLERQIRRERERRASGDKRLYIHTERGTRKDDWGRDETYRQDLPLSSR